MYKSATLSNGIKLVHKKVLSDVAHLGVIISAGSRDEENDEHGIAHFTEHMLFKGTKRRKAYHVLSRIEDIGGEMDAFTTKEETCLSASFLYEFYERTVEFFNDIIFNSVFPDKEIQKEKDIVLDEINSYKDSPSEIIFDDFEDMIFENHPLGQNILGKKKSILQFNKKKIQKFINGNYNTDQMIICSIGSIDFDKLFKYCEKYFGQNPAKYRLKKREKVNSIALKHKTVNKKLHQAHCIIGTQAYPYYNPKKTALMIISNLLAGPSLNSRLNLLLREKYGLSYSVEANYNAFSDTGVFTVYFGADKNKVEKTINLIYKELDKLKNKKLGPLQLSKLKKQITGQIAISSEINSNQLLSMGKSFLIYDKIIRNEDIYKEIDAITGDNIIEVANEIFDINKFSSLIYY